MIQIEFEFDHDPWMARYNLFIDSNDSIESLILKILL